MEFNLNARQVASLSKSVIEGLNYLEVIRPFYNICLMGGVSIEFYLEVFKEMTGKEARAEKIEEMESSYKISLK